MGVNNIRFPHKCWVYRTEGANSFGEETERVCLYGDDECRTLDCDVCGDRGTERCRCRCRKESSTSKRSFTAGKTDRTLTGEYRLGIPGQVKGVKTGDLIDVEDLSGMYEGCVVTGVWVTTMGTSLFFNLASQ